MAVSKTLYGSSRSVPETPEEDWGSEVTTFLGDMIDGLENVSEKIGAAYAFVLGTDVDDTSLAAGATITPAGGKHRVAGASGAITLNATTAIADGTKDNQLLLLEGTSDTNTVTVPAAANTKLPAAVTLGDGDTLYLAWNNTRSAWVQLTNTTVAGNSLDAAYDAGSTITVDAAAVTLNVGANISALAINQTNASRANDVVAIVSDGTGAALEINHSNASGQGIKVTDGDVLMSAGNLDLTSGNVTLTSGNIVITSGNHTLTSGNLEVTSGTTKLNGNTMVGNQTAASELHVAVGAAAANLQLTNTTTGHTSGDGFHVGLDSSGNALLNQKEALTFDVQVNGAKRLSILSDGKVGVGQTTPAQALVVSNGGAAAHYLQVTNSVTGALATDGSMFGVDASGNLHIEQQEALDLILEVNGTDRLHIKSTGDVGISQASPAANLHVHEGSANPSILRLTNSVTGATSGDGLTIGLDGGDTAQIVQNEAEQLEVHVNGARVFTIHESGRGAYSSDNAVESNITMGFRMYNDTTGETVLTCERGGTGGTDILEILNSGSGSPKYINTDAGGGTPAHLTNAGVWTDASCFRSLKNVSGLMNPLRALEVVGLLEVGVYTHKSDTSRGVEEPRRYLSVFQDGLVSVLGLGDDGISAREVASLAISALQGAMLRIEALESAAGVTPPPVESLPGEMVVGNIPDRASRLSPSGRPTP